VLRIILRTVGPGEVGRLLTRPDPSEQLIYQPVSELELVIYS
jgi:hypothetical protein